MIHVPAITEIPVYKTIIAKEINFTACSQKYVNLIFYFQTNILISYLSRCNKPSCNSIHSLEF